MNIAIIGGGASGMTAAIAAADCGASVTVFEHMPRIGRKLILTGSGKCNISNVDMNISHFHGNDIKAIQSVLNKCPQSDTLTFYNKLGLYTKERKGGIYPYCEQSYAVVDILRFAIRDRNIDLHTDCDIRKIERVRATDDRTVEDKFVITTSSKKLTFDRVILCCGSNANRNTGSDGSGYELAKSFGHKLVKPLPALTYLTCEEDFYPSIAGIRTKAVVSLFTKPSKDASYDYVGMEEGELQLTKTGISGVCVFNLSHIAVRALDENLQVKVEIDLLPDITKEELPDFMEKRISDIPERPLEELFIGVLAKQLGILIIKRCSLSLKDRCDSLSEEQIESICKMVKRFDTIVTGSGDTEASQVIQGGVKMSELKENLESRLVSGLFFAGEILDVHGDCGGYNLQWAASSGLLAGREAAK